VHRDGRRGGVAEWGAGNVQGGAGGVYRAGGREPNGRERMGCAWLGCGGIPGWGCVGDGMGWVVECTGRGWEGCGVPAWEVCGRARGGSCRPCSASQAESAPGESSPWRVSPWRVSPWRVSPWRVSPWRAALRVSPGESAPGESAPGESALESQPLHDSSLSPYTFTTCSKVHPLQYSTVQYQYNALHSEGMGESQEPPCHLHAGTTRVYDAADPWHAGENKITHMEQRRAGGGGGKGATPWKQAPGKAPGSEECTRCSRLCP